MMLVPFFPLLALRKSHCQDVSLTMILSWLHFRQFAIMVGRHLPVFKNCNYDMLDIWLKFRQFVIMVERHSPVFITKNCYYDMLDLWLKLKLSAFINTHNNA